MNTEHVIGLGALDDLPSDVQEFLALRDDLSGTPAGGAAVFVVALALWSRDPALGTACLTAALDASHLVDGPEGISGKQPAPLVLRNLRERLGSAAHVVRSYFAGTSPQAGYAWPQELSIRVLEPAGSVGPADAKVFVRSTGADSPRPVRVVLSPKGHWKAREWSSLEVGVRAPANPSADDI